mmetsp:Transcript_24855/g.71553  ORF Transcript_24855/g.71553 Transcript_24855/m.71553 type:complete len:444 (+) Transcript_24855:389-1720(+)
MSHPELASDPVRHGDSAPGPVQEAVALADTCDLRDAHLLRGIHGEKQLVDEVGAAELRVGHDVVASSPSCDLGRQAVDVFPVLDAVEGMGGDLAVHAALDNLQCHVRVQHGAWLHQPVPGPVHGDVESVRVPTHMEIVVAPTVLLPMLNAHGGGDIARHHICEIGHVEGIEELVHRHGEEAVLLVRVGDAPLVVVPVPGIVDLHHPAVRGVVPCPENGVRMIPGQAVLLGVCQEAGCAGPHRLLLGRGVQQARPEVLLRVVAEARQPVLDGVLVVHGTHPRPRDGRHGAGPVATLHGREARVDLGPGLLEDRGPELACGAWLHKKSNIVAARRNHAVHLDESLLLVYEPSGGEDAVLPEVAPHEHVLNHIGLCMGYRRQRREEIACPEPPLTHVVVLKAAGPENAEDLGVARRHDLHPRPVVELRAVLVGAGSCVAAHARAPD